MHVQKSVSAFVIAILIFHSACTQKRITTSATEINDLTGCWQGTLHYAGTVIRKPYTTTAQLVIKQIGKSNKYQFVHIYTPNPEENVADTLAISKEGKMLNNGIIKSKWRAGDSTEIITEATGFDHDENKEATIRRSYTFGKNTYSYKKDIQLPGQSNWLDREQFYYTREHCN